MIVASTCADVPPVPAVLRHVRRGATSDLGAYGGIAGGLQGRLIQHFVRRDSSVVTRSSAVGELTRRGEH